ncbi:toll/interleukin-1 receptor domain-containing protein [Sphingomonas sp.]|uniref:toll/interleukin-1 receptor domain-containing protein n=1 Tax=Sphingomonas sp. TaxID=28214 RepID=UPI00286D02CB|nr:toll/interleukin-1 receptor domain-containing protein [Sphingomonas sp.]
MRPIEKINLVDKIGRELQSRYSFEEIDAFLAEFGVAPPQNVTVNSKWVYSKVALRGASTDTVIRIAEELEMVVPGSSGLTVSPPRNWIDTRLFRLFISHVSKDKSIATRLKECLAPHGIAGFVAHEDIHPTLEWQVEIERALQTMDAFIAVHTEGFSKSVWTQQEVGYALGRGTKIISFKMGEDPTGFISRQQALARKQRSAEAIAMEIEQLLGDDPRTAERLGQAKATVNAVDPLDQDVPF